MTKNWWRSGMAEFVGTFCLIFIGAGAVCANSGLVGVAFAHGLAIMAMVYAVGHVSGTHINPAVTIGLMSQKKISPAMAGVYILFQLAGAIVAGLFLKAIFPAQVGAGLGTPVLSGISQGQGLLVETILTFFLMLAVFGAAVDPRASKAAAGLAIGLTVTFDILMGGGLTGAAMNPARAFGPAVASQHFDNQWIYWLGPILGALLAAYLYEGFLAEKKS